MPMCLRANPIDVLHRLTVSESAKSEAGEAPSCGGWGREGARSEARAEQRLAPGGRQGFLILCRLCAEFERLRDYRVFGNCGRLDECLLARPWLLRS